MSFLASTSSIENTMILFEIETGYMGYSYERCYVWAESEAAARQMFFDTEVYKSVIPNEKRKIRVITKLFDASFPAFITQLSDSGFDEFHKIPFCFKVLDVQDE